MTLIKQILMLAALFSLTACSDSSNTGSFPDSSKATSVTTCSGGSTPIPNPSEYFPTTPNSRWVYKGTASQAMSPNFPYTNEVNITGTQNIAGTQTTVMTSSNYVGQGFDKSYFSVDATKGVSEWSIVLDGTAATPLDTTMFPVSVGKECTQSYSNVDFGPVDPYTANSPHIFGSFDITVTFAAIEPLIVTAGTFTDTLRTEVTQSITASATVGGKTVNVSNNTSITEWSARNVGVLKTTYSSTSSGSPTETATEELVDYIIPVEKVSACITGDAVIASMGYGAEYYPFDAYGAVMMDSYTTLSTYPIEKHTTLLQNKGLLNIQGVDTQHTLEVRSTVSPTTNDTYTSTDNFGAYSWGHLARLAHIQPASFPTPLKLVQFPLSTNAQCNQTLINASFADIDLDGINDTGLIEFSSDVYSFGTVNTPLGSFPNTFEIKSINKQKTLLSSGGIGTKTTQTTEWRAPLVGLIKKTSTSTETNTNTTFSTTTTIEDTQSNSFIKLPYAANDIVYDIYSNKLYASINSGASTYANHIIAIDPATGVVLSSVLAGINPGPLALSQDGSKLYVGMVGEPKVRSLNLPTMTLNPSFSLGGDPISGTFFYAEDLAVVPGDPYSVAVAKFDIPNRNHQGISIYKNGAPLANNTTNTVGEGNIIAFGAVNELFGLPIHSIPQGLSTYTVNNTGITFNARHWSQGVGYETLFINGLLYGSAGKVFNPLTQLSTQDFIFPALTSGVSLMLNTASNSITFLTIKDASLYSTQSFDLTTKLAVGSSKPYRFQYCDTFFNCSDLSASSLQNMGTNGFAFRVFEAYNSLPVSEWGIVFQR